MSSGRATHFYFYKQDDSLLNPEVLFLNAHLATQRIKIPSSVRPDEHAPVTKILNGVFSDNLPSVRRDKVLRTARHL